MTGRWTKKGWKSCATWPIALVALVAIGLLGWWGDRVVLGQKPRKSGCIF